MILAKEFTRVLISRFGIVYHIDKSTLYTISDGVFREYSTFTNMQFNEHLSTYSYSLLFTSTATSKRNIQSVKKTSVEHCIPSCETISKNKPKFINKNKYDRHDIK